MTLPEGGYRENHSPEHRQENRRELKAKFVSLYRMPVEDYTVKGVSLTNTAVPPLDLVDLQKKTIQF